MAISDKLTQIANNVPLVYNAGLEAGKAEGGDDSFGEVFQDGGNRVNYKYACAGAAWTLELLKKAIKYKITFPQEATVTLRRNMGMFYYLNVGGTDLVDMTEICERIDFSGCKTATNLFQNATAKNITVDLSGCETLSNTFATGDGGEIDYINVKVSENAIFGSSATLLNSFNATSITEIRFLEGSVIGNNIKFTSTNLTHESLMSIINALKDFAGTGETRTVTVGTANLARLTDAEKAIATQKGWNLT